MASKYATVGGSYTAATRTIAGATMSSAFASGDVGKAVIFRIGTGVAYSRVATRVGNGNVTLEVHASLPASDGTIDELILLDLGETHSYADYLTELASLIKDDQAKLSVADTKAALKAAVTSYGRDAGFSVRKRVDGAASADYVLATVLGSLWVHGFTQVLGVEYPSGNIPPTTLNVFEDITIYDDGTAQDGTNLKLRFLTCQPSATEHFIIEIPLQLALPEAGAANFPDNDKNFQAITLLAAAYACERLAAAYAQSTDATITADVVNYHDKSSKYQALAKQYKKRYNLAVFGSEEPPSGVQAAMVTRDLDTRASDQTPYLYHARRP
jgi:hypothetical protein